jgi:histidinol-phosphate aminotransferase
VSFSLADLPIRDDLKGLTPYGAPQERVPVALNVNENTHPVPADVAADILEAVGAALVDVNRYPDREFSTLRDSLAGYLGHGLSRDHIWAANGSNEVIQQILQAFGGPGRSVLGFPPTYSMHSIIAAGTGSTWLEGARDEGFTITPETAVAEIERLRPDVVFFCGPNNPTGTPLDLDTVRAAYDATDGMVFVDEAYAEFMPAGQPTALTLLEGRERLIVSPSPVPGSATWRPTLPSSTPSVWSGCRTTSRPSRRRRPWRPSRTPTRCSRWSTTSRRSATASSAC